MNKKVFIPISGLIMAIVAIGIFALRSDTPKEPIKVYKTVTPIKRSVPPTTQARTVPASMPIEDTAGSTTSDTPMPDNMVSEEEAPAEDVPVSPFGFGPYPEVPDDFPYNVNWTKFGKEGELAYRVMIKAWNQGENFVSATTSKNGRVYLIYQNVVWVRYRERLNPDGTVSKYISRAYGPDDLSIPADGTDFPAHVQVRDFDTGGINPYDYLSLQK